MTRGVIASPAIINIISGGFHMERAISPQEVRYYALYWDKIVIPDSNLIHIEIPEEEVLVQTGVIERPGVRFEGRWGGSDMGYSFALAQAEVAKKLIAHDNTTDWVVHQIGSSLILPNEFMEARNTIRCELVNVLPVPPGDAPIADVLDFKQRRSDELNNLHVHLECAYLEALKSPDPELSKKSAIRELSRSIADLERVSSEKWQRTSKFDCSFELNLNSVNLSKAIAASAVLDFFSNVFSVPISPALAGVASLFNIKACYNSTFTPAAKQDKLAYLSHARHEKLL